MSCYTVRGGRVRHIGEGIGEGIGVAGLGI